MIKRELDQRQIQKAADRLWVAGSSKTPCKPVRDLIGADSIDEAYAVQNLNAQRRLRQGDQIVGKKIGLTSEAVQKQLGVDQPDFGMLYRSGWISDGALLLDDVMQAKAEAELAFILKKEIGHVLNLEELLEHIDYALLSLEIVGSRIENWDIRIADTIADNASASHFALSSQKVALKDADLINCEMTLYQNGKLASSGNGKACMGNPLNAALWLVNFLVQKGAILYGNEIILSGALGPMVNLSKGDEILAEVRGFGKLELQVR
jgi:2-keto-4-pentenoate hydratase